jgi:hypothetical protein
MTLKPTDMLEIQSAIDEYEKRFPRRPEPTAEEALAWRLGKREAAKRFRSGDEKKPSAEDVPNGAGLLQPLVRGVLVVGLWSVVAVAVASVFFLGALVGGLK